jgi:hypothetical protein
VHVRLRQWMLGAVAVNLAGRTKTEHCGREICSRGRATEPV